MLDETCNSGFRITTYPAPETMPTEYRCRLVRVPDDPRISAAVDDVIAYLSRSGVWEESENVTDEQMQYLMAEMFYEFSQSEECSAVIIPPSTIVSYMGTTAPDGWLLCDGAQYNQTDYPALSSVLPDELKSGFVFYVPDLRGRIPVGVNAPDELFPLAETGGEVEHELTTDELPSHNHVQNSHNHTQAAHNHTQDSHNHTQAAHNHTQDSHNHTQAAHNHTQDSHNHAVSVRPDDSGFGAGANALAYNTANVAPGLIGTTSTTAVNQAATATNNAATATNQAATATNNATTATNQAATATNNATTATNQAATATNNATTATNQPTGSNLSHNNMPPYFAVNWIIKT